jgi:LacI family transcriptional regulator
VATVSRVLHDSAPVNQATRSRVEDAVRSLRYVPHGGARSLITRRTSTFGVILPDLYGEFFSEVIRGLDEAAREHGYHLLVSSAHSELAEVESAMRAMRGRVDGLAIMSPDLIAGSPAISRPENLPIVLVNCDIEYSTLDSVSVDNVGGARSIVAHLISHGHRRVAIINGPERNCDARERLRGYRAALGDGGLAVAGELELPGTFTEDSGYDAARTLLKVRNPATAVFAANDSMAIGAIAALTEAGRAVPEDVAVAGFDDIPIGRYLTPSLSSVRVPASEIGSRAIACLVHATEHKNHHVRRHEVVATQLAIRNTCGPHDYPRRQEVPASRSSLTAPTPIEAVP